MMKRGREREREIDVFLRRRMKANGKEKAKEMTEQNGFSYICIQDTCAY